VKKADVVVGGRYIATVSGRRVVVEITSVREIEQRKFGTYTSRAKTLWYARNTETNREITIRSAMRLTPIRSV
jgi:nucleoid DNA-binding protein